MLKAANRAALRLWRDESGVILALTVVVFLSLFMMASAIFAGGETIRSRVELQNAADAAAYSAAVVQADCNSRLAAINRAMSWTYVQMVRMEMDYVVDKWLWWTLKQWNRDNDKMMIYNAPSCNQGVPYYVTGKGACLYNSFAHKKILLNGTHLVSTDEIEAARNQAAAQNKSYTALANPIDTCRTQIDQMNEKEKELLQKLPGRIGKTVKEVLKANIKDTWNDGFAGGAQLMYVLKQEEQPEQRNFRVLGLEDEDDFLRHSDYIPEQGSNAREVFKKGTDIWFVQKTPSGDGKGIKRGYNYGCSTLRSEWDYYSSLWVEVDGACVLSTETSGNNKVMGDDSNIRVEEYYNTTVAKPQVLKESFFAKGGSIRVGLTRRLNNPFQFMIGGGSLGVMKPFTLNGGNRYMWTASAAIAGYNPAPRQESQGKYEVTYENNSGDRLWNLKTSDWDAELIPLHRAKATGKNRSWTGETAGDVLNEIKGGSWQALYGGGGALGAQGAPALMNEGAEVSYGGAEAWVLH